MNTEKELEVLKAQYIRLIFLLTIPGIVLAVFVLFASSPTVVQLIAPLSIGAAMIILSVLDIAIMIPIALKMDKIQKRMKKITDDNPELKQE